MIPGAVNFSRLFLRLGHGSHQTFHLVPTVTLLETMLRNRCRPTTFHTITTGDTDKWSQKWPVRSTPQPVHTTGSYVTNGRFSPWDCSVPCKLRWQERPPCHRQITNGSALGGMDAYPDTDDICHWWDETWPQDDRSPRDDHVGASCQILTPGRPIQSAPSTYLAGHMLSHVWAPLASQVGPSLLVKTL